MLLCDDDAVIFSVRSGMDGGARAAAMRAAAAERAGFDQFWLSNDFLGRSGVVGLAAATTATSTIELGLGVVEPVTLHPGQIASIATELQLLAEGRFLLGVGAGSEVFFEHAGLQPQSPLRRTREAIAAIRALMAGASPAADPLAGTTWSEDGKLRYVIDNPPPIYVGAMGPKMLGLSGQLADGALPLCLPPSRFARARALVDAGAAAHDRDLSAFDLVACIWCSIDDDASLARHHMARQIAQYSGSLSADALVEEGLDPAEFQMVQNVVLDKGLDAGAQAVTDAMMTLGVHGGPDEVLAQIEVLANQGVRHLSFGPPMGPNLDDAMRVFGSRILPEARQMMSAS